jgi:cytidylate kinase
VEGLNGFPSSCQPLSSGRAGSSLSDGGAGAGTASSAFPPAIILEGRVPAVMAAFVREVICPEVNVFSVYLSCSPVQQALRYADRDYGSDGADVIRAALLKHGGAGSSFDSSCSSSSSSSRTHFRNLKAVASAIAESAAQQGRPDHSGGSFDSRPGHSVGIHQRVVDALLDNQGRDDVDRSRFKALYGGQVDYRKECFYDLSIDTGDSEPDEKLSRALGHIRAHFDQ